MSDDFDIDFGTVKELSLPAEGDYVLQITDWKLMWPDETAKGYGKGVTVAVVFKFNDPSMVLDENGMEGSEDGDFSKWKGYAYIWVDKTNPFGAKPFFEALMGEENPQINKSMLENKAMWIGETVGATLERDKYKGKVSLKPTSYYSA